MILLWGVSNDSPTATIRAALARRGDQAVFVDQNEVLASDFDLSVDHGLRGVLRHRTGQVDLETITGAYLRPYESSRLPAMLAASPESAARAVAFDHAMLCWSELSRARVVNRPSAMASNRSKPYQLALIHAQGFAVPKTLVTTDAASLEAFWEKHGEVIYKSASGVRSIVSRLTPKHRERFCDLASCPTQFQQWIPGTDFRVHIVGDEAFACEIDSSAVDYRYPRNAAEAPEIRSHCLTEELSGRCRRLAASLGLAVAGIDLRRTPEGEWYCFEVNPSPGFTYYEQATGQPIADAIAGLLAASCVDGKLK
jgi:hypothetical protein